MKLLFEINDNLYLKNPEDSELGRKIVSQSILLISEIGFEQFTFKKLALVLETTEASVYRYFENKHKLLLYIFNWYWNYLDFIIALKMPLQQTAEQKINVIVELLCGINAEVNYIDYYSMYHLQNIVIQESAKVYLIKNVDKINQSFVYAPYKKVCAKIANIILEIKIDFQYAHSFASTLIEASHQQMFFAQHLPRLTDNTNEKYASYTHRYLCFLVNQMLKR